jgi:hypothetical protein
MQKEWILFIIISLNMNNYINRIMLRRLSGDTFRRTPSDYYYINIIIILNYNNDNNDNNIIIHGL